MAAAFAAASVLCTLASAPAWTASPSADRFGPGHSIPDSPSHGTLARTGADPGPALAITAAILTTAGLILLTGNYLRNRRSRTPRR